MNSIRNTLLLAICSLILMNCQKDYQKSDILVLSTKKVAYSGSTTNGVTFSASILLDGEDAILEQGFVVALKAKPTLEDELLHVQELGNSDFSLKYDNVLIPDTMYYVRSFAKTEKHLVYGNEVEFYSNGSQPPVISKIEPSVGFWGDTILITGENFDKYGKKHTVCFNDFIAPVVWGNSDSIRVVVPPILNVNESEVSVKLYGNKSETKGFEILAPTITGLNKTVGQYPDTIIIEGQNLSEYYGRLSFGTESLPSLRINPIQNPYLKKEKLYFQVPFLGDEQDVDLEFNQVGYGIAINSSFHYNEQKVSGLSESEIRDGDTITVYFKNLNLLKSEVKVKIEGNECPQIATWTDSVRVRCNLKSADLDKLEFTLQCQLVNALDGKLITIYEDQLEHKEPEIEYIENDRCAYQDNLVVSIKASDSFLEPIIKDVSGVSYPVPLYQFDRISGDLYNIQLQEEMLPGKYTLQILNRTRYSNIVNFTIEEPQFITINTTKEYIRGDYVEFSGNFLPETNNAYVIVDIATGGTYPTSVAKIDATNFTWNLSDLFGSGTYKLGVKIDDEVYLSPDAILFNDIFHRVVDHSELSYYSYNTSFAFIENNQFIAECYTEDGSTYSFDLSSGERINMGESFFPENNHCRYPVLYKGKFYSIFNSKVYHYDSSLEQWMIEDFEIEGVPVLFCAVEDELYLFCEEGGQIYKKGEDWSLYATVGFDEFNALRFANYYNGNIYFWKAGSYSINKFSLNNLSLTNVFSAPVYYDGGYKGPQHIFSWQGEIYLCYMQRGVYYTSFLKFTPITEQFSFVDGGQLPGRDYKYLFASDKSGNIFMHRGTSFYKFNPNE